jgi:hypothetical protein
LLHNFDLVAAVSTIAGHTFQDTPHGRVCAGCGKRWVDLACVTRADVGKPDIAHEGNLSGNEVDQIEVEKERIWQAVQKVCAT